MVHFVYGYIVTHSPIILGYSESTIVSFDEGFIKEIEYEMADHYQITKYFLQHREKFLKDILDDETNEKE